MNGDVSPSGVEMETDIAVDADAGGRPTSMSSTMGSLAFAWDGPAETGET